MGRTDENAGKLLIYSTLPEGLSRKRVEYETVLSPGQRRWERGSFDNGAVSFSGFGTGSPSLRMGLRSEYDTFYSVTIQRLIIIVDLQARDLKNRRFKGRIY